jgi:hypothetical protein
MLRWCSRNSWRMFLLLRMIVNCKSGYSQLLEWWFGGGDGADGGLGQGYLQARTFGGTGSGGFGWW